MAFFNNKEVFCCGNWRQLNVKISTHVITRLLIFGVLTWTLLLLSLVIFISFRPHEDRGALATDELYNYYFPIKKY